MPTLLLSPSLLLKLQSAFIQVVDEICSRVGGCADEVAVVDEDDAEAMLRNGFFVDSGEELGEEVG